MSDGGSGSPGRTGGGSAASDPFAAWRQLVDAMSGGLAGAGAPRSASDPMSAPFNAQLTAQLTALQQLMETMGTVGGPTTVLVNQLEATVAAVAERREQVRALIDQLTLFDEQLALFAASLQPVLEWSRTWVRVQESVFDPLGLTKRRDDPTAQGR